MFRSFFHLVWKNTATNSATKKIQPKHAKESACKIHSVDGFLWDEPTSFSGVSGWSESGEPETKCKTTTCFNQRTHKMFFKGANQCNVWKFVLSFSMNVDTIDPLINYICPRFKVAYPRLMQWIVMLWVKTRKKNKLPIQYIYIYIIYQYIIWLNPMS